MHEPPSKLRQAISTEVPPLTLSDSFFRVEPGHKSYWRRYTMKSRTPQLPHLIITTDALK